MSTISVAINQIQQLAEIQFWDEVINCQYKNETLILNIQFYHVEPLKASTLVTRSWHSQFDYFPSLNLLLQRIFPIEIGPSLYLLRGMETIAEANGLMDVATNCAPD